MAITYSLCISLDEKGKESQELITSHSLEKLDKYIQENFKDNKDVRKKYDQDIGEFCLHNMKRIQEENRRNHNNRTGGIVILEKRYRNNGELIRTIPIAVIYQGDRLLSREACARKVKRELQDDTKLKDLFYNKDYLLSQNEKDLLGIYLHSSFIGREKYKENGIGFFVRRIREAEPCEAYHKCRHLSHLCDLIVKKDAKKKKIVKKLDNIGTIPKEVEVVKEVPYVEVDYEQTSFINGMNYINKRKEGK